MNYKNIITSFWTFLLQNEDCDTYHEKLHDVARGEAVSPRIQKNYQSILDKNNKKKCRVRKFFDHVYHRYVLA